MNDGYFPDPDQPWVPTLLDVETFKANEPDGSPIDWRRFGWSALDVPEDCTHVIARFDILGERFLQRYAKRMLNQETMELWQNRLQNRFDEVVRMYERAYTLYEQNQNAMMSDVLPGSKRTYDAQDTDGGSDSATSKDSTSNKSKSKRSDTPDSTINESDDYAGSLGIDESTASRENTSTTNYGRTTKRTGTDTLTLTGAQIMDSVNTSIDGWRDIDTSFIGAFENNFMNIWWY